MASQAVLSWNLAENAVGKGDVVWKKVESFFIKKDKKTKPQSKNSKLSLCYLLNWGFIWTI